MKFPPFLSEKIVCFRAKYETPIKTNKGGFRHISVCVSYANRRWYYLTGTASSFDDYMRIVKCGSVGKWFELKNELMPYFNYVEATVKELVLEGFSIEKWQKVINRRFHSQIIHDFRKF